MSASKKPATVGEAYLSALHASGIKHVFANGGTDFAPIIELGGTPTVVLATAHPAKFPDAMETVTGRRPPLPPRRRKRQPPQHPSPRLPSPLPPSLPPSLCLL